MADSTDTFGTSSSLPVSFKIPGYRLRRQVGSDAIGLWFDAEQVSLGRKVTVKVLKPQYEIHDGAIKQFGEEMDRLASLDHENLIRVIDSMRDERLVLVTERIGIKTLEAMLRPGKPLTEGQAILYALGVAKAVQYLAGNGYAYKNLSPQNILPRDDTGCRLVTFRNIIPLAEQVALRGKVAQDVHYIAPEQLTGDDPIGPASHVYQLGTLMFHMLAGQPAFQGDTKTVARAHVTQAMPSLRRYQPFLDKRILNFVGACAQREMDRRPGLVAVIDGLQLLLDGKDPGIAPEPSESGPAGTASAPKPRRRRRRR